MNLINELTEYVTPLLEKKSLTLYDVAFVNEMGMRILRVMIYSHEGSIDLDVCSEISEVVSKKLDEIDSNESEYYLEVCSAGAERELRNQEEIHKAIGSHIFIKLKNPTAGVSEVTGDLIGIDDEMIEVEYRVKTAKKKLKVNVDQITFIRLAVRL